MRDARSIGRVGNETPSEFVGSREQVAKRFVKRYRLIDRSFRWNMFCLLLSRGVLAFEKGPNELKSIVRIFCHGQFSRYLQTIEFVPAPTAARCPARWDEAAGSLVARSVQVCSNA